MIKVFGCAGCLVAAVLVKIMDPAPPGSIDGDIDDSCGAEYCPEETYFYNDTMLLPTVRHGTSTMMLSVWFGLGVLALGISCGLLDSRMKEPQTVSERSSAEHWLRAVRSAFQDPRLQLASPLALFIGLEQGFMFADFTEVRISFYTPKGRYVCQSNRTMRGFIDLHDIFSLFFFFLYHQQAYVVCALGGAGTVTLSFLSLALLQAIAGVTLSMLLRHIRRYFVVGE